ncbi:PucR family transcriptional regulator ligand-binding domain-containing protein [Amycolatopsis sp. 195334CR]|uniref:helix-turn-helix domain-containing protein n=1 Tax=Amycolatopsis sp. 195334CR TaxID=2814588 RepID=UPI001A8CE2BA|nr:PucR family transcriptional regulator ligand-binding domain-containing protein [Amycolatopsis sp. 195334CR]MBN6033415.1 PucR family transcriptional regulator ligand-binding domain-containing protein [Amycolatopsis sp. 195334CR]
MTVVKTLLELPELRLRLRGGGDLLDRRVTRVYGTELPDPSRYLSAGELVLTGLLWWRAPGDADPFVAALARAGTAALAASGADSGGIPDDLVQACERHHIPLLEVPPDLSFAVIVERVVLALAAEREAPPGRLPAHAAELPLPDLLRLGSAELGVPCWVLAGTGRVVAGTGLLLPEAEPLAAAFSMGAEVDSRHTVLPAGAGFTVPWALVTGGAADWATEQHEIAAEVAALVGRSRVQARQTEVERSLFRGLNGGGDLGDAFAAAGWAPDTAVRVVLTRTVGEAVAGDLLDELLAGYPLRVLRGRFGEDSCALVAADGWPADWAPAATRALSTVEPALAADRVLVGVGGPAALTGVRGAVEEAVHALEVGANREDRVAVVPGEEIGVHRLVLAGVSDELRTALRRRVLGPLLDYDAAQHSDLVHTVRVFLESSGSPAVAAKALHIHVNTLRYRIGRASELLGLDLTDFTNQVDVYLALRISS